MSNTVEGIVKQYPQMQQGNGQNGQWYKQEMIVETYGQYPKLVRITFMNEKIDGLRAFPIGSPVKVSVNLESKEYNNKWYDSINGWKVENGSQTAAPTPAQVGGAPAQNGFPMPAMPQSPFNNPQQPVAGFGAYPTNQAPAVPGQPLQQVVDQAQQNYQVQSVWDGQKWVHPHTGQPWAAPAPQSASAPTPAPMPAPIPSAPPQQSAPQPQLPPQTDPNNWNQNSIPF